MINNYTNIFWQKHALQRMLERSILRSEVKDAIKKGIIIERYEEDTPYPSLLIASLKVNKPLHVVIAFNENKQELYVVTAYKPDTQHFEKDLMTRKKDDK